MTAYASVETAVEALRFGAYNYIKKPFSSDELILMLDKLKALRGKHLLKRHNRLSKHLGQSKKPLFFRHLSEKARKSKKYSN